MCGGAGSSKLWCCQQAHKQAFSPVMYIAILKSSKLKKNSWMFRSTCLAQVMSKADRPEILMFQGFTEPF